MLKDTLWMFRLSLSPLHHETMGHACLAVPYRFSQVIAPNKSSPTRCLNSFCYFVMAGLVTLTCKQMRMHSKGFVQQLLPW